MTVLYLDLSHHDRDRRKAPLDFGAIAESTGQGTVMVARASYGDPAGYSPETRFHAEHQAGAAAAGYTCRGGYHNLIHGDAASHVRQVDYLRREMDSTGATWGMLDVEPYAALRANGLWPRWDDVLRFHERWSAVESRVLSSYIGAWVWSGWLGSPDLTVLPGPLANANYPPNAPGTPAEMYAAAGSVNGPGWVTYGGMEPDTWQFTSRCSIPGASSLTDVNAYRGTLPELVALLGGDMVLPIRAVTRPAVLAGTSNGKLPASILVDTPGLAGGPTVRLAAPAARCWRALTAAASRAGHTLKATSLYDSYRPYEVQERIFRERYTTTPLAGRPTRTWQGQTWYQRPGTAAAAVPGTSNHGWGLAVDIGEERDGDSGTESLDSATLAWLVNNELRFGFSHELQSEPWHVRCFVGDAIPPAVLAEENDDMDATQFLALLRDPKVSAEMSRLPWAFKPAEDDAGGNTAHGLVLRDMRRQLAGQAGQIAELLARPTTEPAPVDPATIKAALLDPEVLKAIAETNADVIARRTAE